MGTRFRLSRGWFFVLVLTLTALVATTLTSSTPVLAASPGVQLSEAVPRTEIPLAQQGGTFLTVTKTVTYRSGAVILSSSGDGSGDIITDDGMTLRVKKKGSKGPGRSLDIDFSNGCTTLSARRPTDVTKLFEKGANEVTLSLRDRCGTAYSSLPYFLAGKVALLSPLVQTQLGRGTNAGVHDDPVNTRAGNFEREETDLAFAEHVFGLEWGRVYNARDDEVGAFGQGWSTSLGPTVTEGDDGLVTFRDVDGRTLEFARVDGGYARPVGLPGELTKEADGTFAVGWFSGEIWRFDPSGRLAGKRNWDGQEVTLSYAGDRLAVVSGGYGYGLTFTYDEAGRLVAATASDGRRVSYGFGSSGLLEQVTDPTGATTAYSYDEDGRLTRVTDADGVVVVQVAYDSEGRVVSQETAAGAKADFVYDDAEGTTSVTDGATGSKVVYDHDPAGQLLKTSDPAGASVSQAYDGAGNPVTVTSRSGVVLGQTFDAHGSLSGATLGGATVQFVHDDLDRLVEATDATGAVTRYTYEGASRLPSTVTDPTGAVTSFEVDAGQVKGSRDPDGVETRYGYDPAGNLASVTDGAGSTTRFEYDGAGRLTSTTSALGAVERRRYDPAGRLTEVTDPTGAVTAYQYSPAGRLAGVVDPTGARATFSYNGAGLLAKEVDASGGVTAYEYDDAGNRTAVTDPSGRLTRFAWDELSRLVAETDPGGAVTRHSYDADGQEVATTDPLGGETRQAFDERGRLTMSTDAAGAVTRLTYDDADRPVSEVDPNGAQRRTEYDRAGRVTAEVDPLGATTRHTWTPGGRLSTDEDPLGRVTRYAYDGAGRLAEVTSPGGGVTRYAYDAEDRLVAETSPAGLVTRYAYDAAGRVVRETAPTGSVTTTEYSPRGEQLSVTSPGGAVRRFAYDPTGRLVSAVDANGVTTGYGYDPAGRLTELTDAKGGASRFGYDATGREMSRSDPLGRTTRTAYDAAGRPVSTTLPTGEVIEAGYDAMGRLLHRTAAGTAIRFTYDPAGRRVSMEDPVGVTRYQYDAADRLVTVTRPDGSAFTTTYDAAGQPTGRRYPSGRQVRYGYNPDGDLVRLTAPGPRGGSGLQGDPPAGAVLPETISFRRRPAKVRLLGDDDGRGRRPEFLLLASAAAPPALDRTTRPVAVPALVEATFETDPDGRLLREMLPGGGTRSYQYQAGLLSSFAETLPGDPAPRTTGLERDADGRVVAETTGGKTTRYAYDPAGQLVGVTGGPGGPLDFQYDATGNRTAMVRAGVTTGYSYDAAHQLVEARRGWEATSYTYDAAGRLERQAGPGSAKTTTYDPFGHIATQTTVAGSGTEARSYAYDGDDLLAAMQTTTRGAKGTPGRSIQERLQWSADGGVPEVLTHSGPDGSTDFVYGYERLLAAGDQSGEVFSNDVAGSALGNPSGGSWARAATYGPFGEPAPADRPRPGDLSFGYRGELSMGDTLYLRARTYDPETGRFTTPDPLDGVPGEVTAANPYPYAANDPVNQVDPLGLRPTDAAFRCPPGRVSTTLTALGGQKYRECRPPKEPFGRGIGRGLRFLGKGVAAVGRGTAAVGRFAVRNRGTLATIGASAGCLVPAVGQVACGGLQAGAYGVRAQQRGYRNVKANSIDAAITLAPLGARAFAASRAARAAPQTAGARFVAGSDRVVTDVVGKAPNAVSIGHYPAYVDAGARTGARTFSMSDEAWSAMSTSEQWIRNQRFLDRAMAQGSEIRLATRVDLARPGSFFERELQYLFKHGYSPSADGTMLIRGAP